MKTYYCVDKDGSEWCSNDEPIRDVWVNVWAVLPYPESHVQLPKGTIKTITGRGLTWKDEPIEVEIK